MSGERCGVVMALLAVMVLSAGVVAWAAEAESADELLREQVARERIVREKRQAEAQACLSRGRELYQDGRYQQAQSQLEQAVRLDPDLAEAGQLLEQVRSELGLKPVEERLLEAQVRRREVAREALRARVESLLLRAAEQRQGRRYDEALDTLNRAANLVRYSPYSEELSREARRVDGQAEAVARERDRYQVRLQQERRREALSVAARRKVEAQAQLRATETELLGQAEALYKRGRYHEAGRLAEVVANVNPDNTQAHILLGRAERQASRERFLALSDERARDYREHWEATQEATRIRGERETIIYPDDWKELTRRRRAVAATSFGPAKAPWRSRLQEQLQRPITFEFTEAPLSDVVEFLRTVSEANIVLDTRGIQAAGKDPKMPITLKIKDVSLADTLDWVMELSGLTYALRRGAILISDPTQMAKETHLAVYDVRDVLASVTDFAGPSFDLEADTGGGDGFDFEDDDDAGDIAQYVSTQMSGEDLVQFIIKALGLEGELY